MIVFLVGPTAVGKSEIALRLAEEEGAAILSLDSMQVYAGLDIGTGKPTAEERARVVHGGLDLVPWWEQLDTARYLAAAVEFLKAQAGRPVYVVGGTGLYFRALTRGLTEAPPAPPELRRELAALSVKQLQGRLRAVDPEQHPDYDWENPRRLQRSLEVILSSGVPMREWHRRSLEVRPPVSDYRAVVLQRERDDLRARIAARTAGMIEKGWLDEVRSLAAARSLDEVGKCAAIGYAELAQWLERGGDFSLVEEEIVNATRQYAKRQLTWFKREPRLEPLMIPSGETASATASRLRALLNPA